MFPRPGIDMVHIPATHHLGRQRWRPSALPRTTHSALHILRYCGAAEVECFPQHACPVVELVLEASCVQLIRLATFEGRSCFCTLILPSAPRYPSSLSSHPKASTRLVYVQRDGGIRVVSGGGLLAKVNYARAPNQRGEPTLRSRRLCSHRHSFTISSGSVLCNVKTGWHQWPDE